MKDVYDDHIDELMDLPPATFSELIEKYHWEGSRGLFKFLNRLRDDGEDRTGRAGEPDYGCATMIKGGRYVAQTVELTEMVRNDPLIPNDPADIPQDRAVLERFAYYQRYCDQHFKKAQPQ